MAEKESRVLIYHADDKIVDLLKISLEERAAYECVATVTLEDFWAALDEKSFDLIISDVFLSLNAEHPIEELLQEKQSGADRILFCGFTEMKNVKSKLSRLCDGFLTKPWTNNQLDFLIKQMAKKASLLDSLEQEEAKVRQLDLSVSQLECNLKAQVAGTIESLQFVFEMQSRPLLRHCKRVAIFARQTGQNLGLDEESLEDLELAALFHDFGLSFLSENLHTNSLSYMSSQDKKSYKKHPEASVKLLESIPRFSRVLDIIRYHHENVDGSGFYNMTYRTLSMETMILRICDFYDEEERFNTNAYQNILNSMRLKRDTWFDSSCLDAFLDVVTEVKKG